MVLLAAIGLVGIYYAVGMQDQQADPTVTETTVNQEPADEEGPQGGDQVSSPETDSEAGHTSDEGSEDSVERATENSGGKSDEEKPDAAGSKANGKTDTGTKKPTDTPASSGSKESEGDGIGTTEPSNPAKNVTINFVGDIQFSGKVAELLDKNGYDYPFAKLGNLFKEDDLTIGNLETPVTLGGTGAADKTYVYKSSPKALKAMASAGFDAVNLLIIIFWIRALKVWSTH